MNDYILRRFCPVFERLQKSESTLQENIGNIPDESKKKDFMRFLNSKHTSTSKFAEMQKNVEAAQAEMHQVCGRIGDKELYKQVKGLHELNEKATAAVEVVKGLAACLDLSLSSAGAGFGLESGFSEGRGVSSPPMKRQCVGKLCGGFASPPLALPLSQLAMFARAPWIALIFVGLVRVGGGGETGGGRRVLSLGGPQGAGTQPPTQSAPSD